VITFYWQMVRGRAECVGLEITSVDYCHNKEQRGMTPPGGWPVVGKPVTTSLLRSIKLGELISWHRGKMARIMGKILNAPSMRAYAVTPTMRPFTESRLREVAEVYCSAWSRGQQPTRAVAKRFGVSVSAAGKLVYRARTAGLLPPTSRGVAGVDAEQRHADTEESLGG
jgi:hypothetical protein